MARILLVLGGLALAFHLAGGESPAPTPEDLPPAGGCGAGCAAVPEDTDRLAPAEIEELLEKYSRERIDAASPTLETLLFHAEEVREYLAYSDDTALDAERGAFLDHELARTHATIELRVVDAEGVERMRLTPHDVPLGEKQHLHADETECFQPPEVSFTVRRVGLAHLWTRL